MSILIREKRQLIGDKERAAVIEHYLFGRQAFSHSRYEINKIKACRREKNIM
jgi:hypothetical protein